MSTDSARTPRGMRDLLPRSARRRQYVVDTLRSVFELYGYEPLETPALEQANTLTGKYGPEAERLIYRAGLGTDPDLALRYDLSVPLARVSATYQDLPRPFRRYQIGAVWRGERPQRGRYREILQADVDVVGSDSMLADAEIIALVVDALGKLGFVDTLTKINNRKLLNAIGRHAGVPDSILPGLYRALDKLDKVGLEGVRIELSCVGLPSELVNRQRQAVERWLRGQADRDRLESDLVAALGDEPPDEMRRALCAFLDELQQYPSGGAGGMADDGDIAEATRAVMSASARALRGVCPIDDQVPDAVIDRLLDLLQLQGESRGLLADLRRRLDDPSATEGITEMLDVLDGLDAAGIPAPRYQVDFAMVRGLEYYTGTIFETVVTAPPVGSITGGGRYDGLIGLFGRDSPAVGTSFGVDRLVDVMEETGLFDGSVDLPPADVLVTRFSDETTPAATAFAARLRGAGVRTEQYLATDRLGDQIRYALKRAIPFVAVLGPEEAAAGTVTLRDLDGQTQATLDPGDAVGLLQAATRE